MIKSNAKHYKIMPLSKPRMTRSDKWRKRPCVLRYREYKDTLNDAGFEIDSGDHVIFKIPMPKSWSKKKKQEHEGLAHEHKPDVDNLLKAVFDAAHNDDSHIHDIRATKIWSDDYGIVIQDI